MTDLGNRRNSWAIGAVFAGGTLLLASIVSLLACAEDAEDEGTQVLPTVTAKSGSTSGPDQEELDPPTLAGTVEPRPTVTGHSPSATAVAPTTPPLPSIVAPTATRSRPATLPAGDPGLSVDAIPPVAAGGLVSVSALSAPGLLCTVMFVRLGVATLPGPPRLTDPVGRVSWTWVLPPTETPGTAQVRVACGPHSSEVQMIIL